MLCFKPAGPGAAVGFGGLPNGHAAAAERPTAVLAILASAVSGRYLPDGELAALVDAAQKVEATAAAIANVDDHAPVAALADGPGAVAAPAAPAAAEHAEHAVVVAAVATAAAGKSPVFVVRQQP